MRHAEDAAADVLPAAAVGIPLANGSEVGLQMEALHLRALDQRRGVGEGFAAGVGFGVAPALPPDADRALGMLSRGGVDGGRDRPHDRGVS